MASMNRNKDTKRRVGGTSGSALVDTTRQSIPPPAPAPDIPHPLGELPPEAVEGRISHKNRTAEDFSKDLQVGMKVDVVSAPRVIKRQSGAAKKSATKG